MEYPYRERNFIVDDSDKDLFIMMKSIIDAGFPPVTDIMIQKMSELLYLKKRKYAFKELKNGSIYFYFPKINPIKYFIISLIFKLRR